MSQAPPEPTPPEVIEASAAADDVSPQLLLQILATEHWSLLASRNLAWNEAFARTSMFLSTLSFALVALALVGQATGFGEEFRLFALVVLPVVLFVGITTSLRLDSANYHELICIVGMNRIRANYVEIAPALERVFVVGLTDDVRGVELTAANPPHRGWVASVLAATPALLAVLNATLCGTIVALLTLQIGFDTLAGVLIGIVVAIGAFVVQAYGWKRDFDRIVAEHRPLYPGADSP